MSQREARTAIDAAAIALRGIVLGREPGAMIGSEDALIATLGCSRSTLRQAARLLEREGLLKVRRGINGGYFGSRPDAGSIEATVSAYLEALDIDPRDVTIVASALWVEAMRKAAGADGAQARALAERLRAKVGAIRDDAGFEKIREVELLIQAEIFALARSAYVKLIFDINVAFSKRRFAPPNPDDTSEAHRHFVRAWRGAKALELSAIAEGDRELAAMAGMHSRKIWHQRIAARHAQ
ncbi:MAG: GntR family transcriptional regulator [Sphingomonadales bacterium]|nr:GntR family transcriptional regulator [Sphingomonadales bacterium]